MMHALLFAGLVMASAALASVVLFLYRKRNRRAQHRLLQRLSEQGSRHQLSFSSQEVLPAVVLGLDGLHRTLMVLELQECRISKVHVIHLRDVAGCFVTRQFGSTEPWLPARIGLQFQFRTAAPALDVPFFQSANGGSLHWQQLEQKARDWSAILTKMLDKPVLRQA